MKKTLRLFQTVVLVTMMLSNVSAYAASPSSWATAEVNEARGKGLVLPEADGDYQEYITRELFCKSIVNLVELTTGSPVIITITNPFTDTNDTDIIKAYQLGIVNGTSVTTFAPYDLIKREEVAAMMMRAVRELDSLMGSSFSMIQLAGEATFADTAEISAWALADVREANSLGIMNGVGNNRINPQGKTSIEESILLILRVFNEYLPLIENMAPLPLPTGVYEYNVAEGDSVSFDLVDIAYDPDGDSMTLMGVGGNTTYGKLSRIDETFTFTAEMVDANMDSLWHVTVSDGTEQTQINFTFHVVDEANEAPYGLQILPYTVNEGESINIGAEDIAIDPEGEAVVISDYTLDETTPIEYGVSTWHFALLGYSNSVGFTADLVDADKQIKYNMTVTDGSSSIVLTITVNIINVNDPPVGIPTDLAHIFYQDESTDQIYWGFDVATDPDEDTLTITDFAIGADNIYDLGTASIRDFDGIKYFYFEADAVTAATWTFFDLTVTDGIHEVIVPIRIQVDNN